MSGWCPGPSALTRNDPALLTRNLTPATRLGRDDIGFLRLAGEGVAPPVGHSIRVGIGHSCRASRRRAVFPKNARWAKPGALMLAAGPFRATRRIAFPNASLSAVGKLFSARDPQGTSSWKLRVLSAWLRRVVE